MGLTPTQCCCTRLCAEALILPQALILSAPEIYAEIAHHGDCCAACLSGTASYSWHA